MTSETNIPLQSNDQSTPLDKSDTTVTQDNAVDKLPAGASDSTSEARGQTVSLCLVHRPHPADNPQFAESISVGNSKLLAEWYVTKDPTKEQADFALYIMRRAKQEDLWIACSGCASKPDQPESSPIMVAVDFGNDSYTLRRLPDRAEHAPCCPFNLNMVRKSAPNIDEPETEMLDEEEPDLLKGRPINIGRARQPGNNRRERTANSRARGTHSLYQYFCYLMAKAGLNKVRPPGSYEGDRAALMAAAAGIGHQKNKALTVHDCLLVDPVDHDVLPMLFATSNGMWPADELPVGYVIIVCDAVDRSADGRCTIKSQVEILHTKFGTVRARPKHKERLFSPECPVRVAEIQGLPVCGPYLVMLRAEKDAGGTPMWIEGIARPIVSRSCWLAVRSDTERDAHNAIRQVVSDLEAANIPHDIHFVLKTMKNDAGETCAPDICARRLNVTPPVPALLIETQNTCDPGYHERKLKQHRIMQEVGTLYIDDRMAFDREEADKRLISRLRAYFGLPDPLLCADGPQRD